MTDYPSASFLSHLETPFGPAFLRYPAFSCGVQRNRTTAVEGFLSGGLPRGFLGMSMAPIMWLQIVLDKWDAGVFNVATLMEHKFKVGDVVKAKSGATYRIKDLAEAGRHPRLKDGIGYGVVGFRDGKEYGAYRTIRAELLDSLYD